MTNPFQAELAKRQGVEAPPPAAPGVAPPAGDNPFAAELSRRGVDPTPSIKTLQNSGQPLREGLTEANRAIADSIGGAGELLNAPGRALTALTNRAGLTNYSNNPEDGIFPTKKEVRAGFEGVGIDVTPKPDAERTPAESAAGRAGEVIGLGASFMIPGTAAVKAGAQGKGALGFLEPIGRNFVKNPAAFAATEVGTLSGAAQGAAAAELAFPGSDLAGFVGEVAGGFVNPTSAVAKAGPRAANAAGRVASTFTKAGREAAASKTLIRLAKEAGEDPKDLAAALKKSDVVPNNLPSGAKTGSEAMLRLEASVARDNAKFRRESEVATTETFERIRVAIDDMAKSGDPDAVRMAASLRQKNFENLLEGRVRSAEAQAMEVASKLTGAGRSEGGRRVEATLRRALDESRAAETALWNKVPRDIPVTVADDAPFAGAVNDARSRLLGEEVLPFQRTINKILKEGATDSGELITLRSRLLDQARKFRSERDFGKAGVASDLAEAVRLQLDTVANPAFDEARGFSNALNKAFTQSFAGDALRTDAVGGARMAPEIVLDRAFAGGRGGSAVRFREIEDAAKFADDQGGGFLFRDAVRGEQEDFLRSAAGEVVKDGKINQAKLDTFMKNNKETLDRFPNLAADLQDAKKAATLLKTAQDTQGAALKAVQQKAVFAKVLGVEDATKAVGKAMRGDNPGREVGQLVRMARKSGPEAVAGLKTSIIDDAVARASTGKGVDFQGLHAAMSKPASRGGPSTYGVLSSNQLMKADELTRLKGLIKRAADIERNISKKLLKEDLIETTDPLTDLIIRVQGAKLGSQLATGSGSGTSLVAAGAGSRFLRGVLEKIPASRSREVLIRAAEDPKFAAALLQRPTSEHAKRKLGQQLNVFLLQAGIIAEDEQDAQTQ